MKFGFIFLLSSLVFSSFAADFIPEASGVCKMGENLIIAGDEEPESLWLLALGGKLERIKIKGAMWDDMEGLAAVSASQFFAVTSHSLTKKGKRRPGREQLLLLSQNNKKIEIIRSWSLRDLILTQLKKSHSKVLDMKAVEAGSPNEGGLNIEGLAYHEGKLYLGLRSPITSKGEALIVVIKNGEALLQGKAPVLEEVMDIQLSGRGIRSLDSYQAGVLILSGSQDDSDLPFGLDHLAFGTGILQGVSRPGFENLIRPEGVVADQDGSVIFVQDFQEPQNQEIIIQL